MNDDTVSVLSHEHVKEVAELHCASLTGLLSELGTPLIEHFYKSALRSEHNCGWIYQDAHGVGGFIFGTTCRDRLYKDVARQNPLPVVGNILKQLVIKPRIMWHVGTSFLRKTDSHSDVGQVELVFLVVDPARRGAGIGRKLVNQFSAYVQHKGCTRYEVSVDLNHKSAVAFYEKIGFTFMYAYKECNISRARYLYNLTKQSN